MLNTLKRAAIAAIAVLVFTCSAFAQVEIPNGSSSFPLLFMMWSSSDHVTPVTGLSPTVTISKNGGTFASPSGAVTEIANGLYKVAGNATDTNTNGPIWLHATGTAADPFTYPMGLVVAVNSYDAVHFGISALPNAAAEASGGLFTRGTGAGQINQAANGLIDVSTLRWNGTAVATPATAGIPDVNVKNINNVAAATPGAAGGLFIAGTNAATTINGTAAAGATPAVAALTLTGGAASTTGGGVASAGLLVTGGAGAGSTNGAVDGAVFAGGGTNTVASTASGIKTTGTSTGHGILATSGAGATGNGITATSAATAGQGFSATGNGTGHGILATSGGGATGDGFKAISAATNGNGLNGVGTGTGADILGDKLEQFMAKAVVTNLQTAVADNSALGYLLAPSVVSAYDRTTDSLHASFVNAPTVQNIVDGVLNEAASGHSTAGTIGKKVGSLPDAAAGASTGLLISGSNAGTTTLGALTVTGATTHTGNVVLSDGLTVSAPSTTNRPGIAVTGNGTGAGFSITSGNGATGNGMDLIAASTNGHGFSLLGNGTGSGLKAASVSGDAILTAVTTSGNGMTLAGTGTSKHGLNATGGATTSNGINAVGGGAGHGLYVKSGSGATGDGLKAEAVSTNGSGINAIGFGVQAGINVTAGATGYGVLINGGSSSGDGIGVITASGHGITVAPNGSSKHGLNILGGNGGTSDGIRVAAGTGGVAIRANITGNITGTIDTVTTVNGLAANSVTAAAIATDADTEIENAVLNATTAGHSTAGSIGKAIADASSAGDPWSTALPGAYSAGTAGFLIGTHITGNAFTRLGAPAGASISADIAAAKIDTAAIKTKTDFLPSATAGAAGGVTIAGSNAATTFATLTSTGAFSINGTGNVAQTGDGYGRLGAPTGASVSADIANIKAILPTALVGGKMDSNISSMNANSLTDSAISALAVTKIQTGLTTLAKNTSFTSFPIWMLSSAGAGVTGATVSCVESIDSGAFAALTNPVTEISRGKYIVTLSQAETNGNALSIECTATGATTYRTNVTPQR